jgi:TusA-related sulfurtransferase
MTADLTPSEDTPQALLDFHQTDESAGTTCALLTPAIKAKLREMASGQVLEVRVDDPAAKEDILSWSRLTGNEVVSIWADDAQHLRFYVRRK